MTGIASIPDSGDAIGVVVCVPTFRRPALLTETLNSLVTQTFSRRFAVVVIDNDAAGQEGMAIAKTFLEAGRLTGLCLAEPRQGNCFAINTAFATALDAYPKAGLFLMIDDDETASPQWLERMVEATERSGADIVGGPVMPRLEAGARPGLAAHPAYIPAYTQSGPVPVIYGSGNCLISRKTFERLGAPAFDVGYNFLGGGDTDFFTRARRAGFRFHWAADALITETVPLARTTTRWLAARGLRIGAVNHRIEAKHAAGLSGRVTIGVKSLAVLGFSFVRGLRLLARTREPMIALHPVLVALGRCLAAAGIEPQAYRAAAPK